MAGSAKQFFTESSQELAETLVDELRAATEKRRPRDSKAAAAAKPAARGGGERQLQSSTKKRTKSEARAAAAPLPTSFANPARSRLEILFVWGRRSFR